MQYNPQRYNRSDYFLEKFSDGLPENWKEVGEAEGERLVAID